jgi:transposase
MSVASSVGDNRRRRRVRSEDEKRRIIAETLEHGASVSVVARRHDVNANLLFTWRRKMGAIASTSPGDPIGFIPAVVGIPARTDAAPTPSGRMEIVLAGGDRVIVDRTVDAVALSGVIEVLSRRHSMTTPERSVATP